MTAFSATFADFKIIKGRKQAQIILEVPIEHANAALAALGGVPRSDNEQWVGVAPITPEAAEKAPEERKGGKLAQRAGILCGEQSFGKFLTEECNFTPSATPEDRAKRLRTWCGVTSRAHLDHDVAARSEFLKLDAEYRDWMRA